MKKLNFEKDLNQQIKKVSEVGEDLRDNFQKKSNKTFFLIFTFLVVAFGIGSGYFLALGGRLVPEEIKSGISKEEVKAGVIVGSGDEKTFPDSAEGVLIRGGIDGEGSHHLVRDGGESQNVYLTSSIVVLDNFEGHKVKVWGETFAARKAGWLMDVGKLKVLE
jgi:hypothetical protein